MKRISTSATPTAALLFIFTILISGGGKEYGGLLGTASALATDQSDVPTDAPTDAPTSIIKRYIVKFKNATDIEDGDVHSNGSETMFHTQSVTRTERHYRLSRDDPHLIMTLPKTLVDTAEVMTIDTEEDLLYWQNHEDVEYVEQDSKVYPHQSLPSPSFSLSAGESIPWGIERVKALDVNDDNVSNQKVCIIDTGYDVAHPDLPSSSTVTGKSQIESESWKKDGAGHGTHVAGTIAAIGGNNEGVVGVNRNGQIKLHIVKVFDNNGSWTWASDLMEAVASCVAAGSTVVNMSLGGGAATNAEKEAYEKVYKQDGVLLVASAGNGGNSAKSYPASYSAVFSVGATNKNNQRASFSQYNNEVDICAPGVDVKSTVPGGRYSMYDGTSMSSPHVAGVAALVWSHFPNKNAQQIRQALESSAKDLGTAGRDNEYGHGLIQADGAYNLLSGGGGGGRPNPAPVPAPTPNSKCTNSPIDWHDSDGSDYNCGWYAQQDRCTKYGDYFSNRDKTANQACCACGGGQTSESTKAPVPAPVSPPVKSPTPVSECTDSPIDWYDRGGPKYNCKWYAKQNRCSKYGNNFRNKGKTANQACCVCGGGNSGNRPPAPAPTPSNTMMCGCSSCTTEILNREIRPGVTVLRQINWIVDNGFGNEIEACTFTCSGSFRDFCNPECDPASCNS